MTPDRIGKSASSALWKRAALWLSALDPGGRRRRKGFGLVAAYGLAAMGGSLVNTGGVVGDGVMAPLAGGFALWASVSEGENSRWRSSRDLVILVLSAVLAAMAMAVANTVLRTSTVVPPELMLVAGAFLVGYLRRFGRLGTGAGSQIFIGMALAFGFGLQPSAIPMIFAAGVIAAASAVASKLIFGPVAGGDVFLPLQANSGRMATELVMGFQAALPALVIVGLNAIFELPESVWAITACTYVVVETSAATIVRIRHRVIGTMLGVSVGLAFVPLIDVYPVLVWMAAGAAMIIYAMAPPDRYDLACAAFAFALMITLALGDAFAESILAFRIWETLLGCGLGFIAVRWLLPLHMDPSD